VCSVVCSFANKSKTLAGIYSYKNTITSLTCREFESLHHNRNKTYEKTMSSEIQLEAPLGSVTETGAVSWSSVFAGAAAAAALSLILLILGTGLGLSSVSPWSSNGISATTLGISTILWITLTQVAASGMGGYLTGRLRSRWVEHHKDEIYFRDTVHGFLAWAVASLLTAALLTSAVGSILSGTTKIGTAAVTSAGSNDKNADVTDGQTAYFLDSLFRGTTTAITPGERSERSSEINRIFMNAMPTDSMPAVDARYIADLVVQRTGLSQSAADTRVTDTFDRLKTKNAELQNAVKDAANKTRKASAYAALWLFISLLIGAFAASYLATFGGKRRDAAIPLS
jgi:hypothetical protein